MSSAEYWKQCAKMRFQMFEIDRMADELVAQQQDVIRLAVGIAEEPTPEAINRIICGALLDRTKSQRVLPFGLPALRAKIAAMATAWV